MMTAKQDKTRYHFWSVLPRDAGQIVTRHYPQVAGGAEGTGKYAERISLITEGVTWRLLFDGIAVLAGRREHPEADTAVGLLVAAERHRDHRERSICATIDPPGRLGYIVRALDGRPQ